MIVLVHDMEADALKSAGVIVQCATCANAGPVRASLAPCGVLGSTQAAEPWRLCGSYLEKTATARPERG